MIFHQNWKSIILHLRHSYINWQQMLRNNYVMSLMDCDREGLSRDVQAESNETENETVSLLWEISTAGRFVANELLAHVHLTKTFRAFRKHFKNKRIPRTNIEFEWKTNAANCIRKCIERCRKLAKPLALYILQNWLTRFAGCLQIAKLGQFVVQRNVNDAIGVDDTK